MDHLLNTLEGLIADERGRQAVSGSRDADLFALATQHGGVEHVVAVLKRYGSLIARFPVGAENLPFDAGLLSMLNMIQPSLELRDGECVGECGEAVGVSTTRSCSGECSSGVAGAAAFGAAVAAVAGAVGVAWAVVT